MPIRIPPRLTGAVSLAVCALLGACQPPAADDYFSRSAPPTPTQTFASAPLASPDVTGAVWAPADRPGRLLYGVPGHAPMLAIACDTGGGQAQIVFTRFAPADRHAKAMMAVIGNGHVLRMPVDAQDAGPAWLWSGRIAADTYGLNVLTGQRPVTVTIPGAGLLKLHGSPLPGALVKACRAARIPEAAPQMEAEAKATPAPAPTATPRGRTRRPAPRATIAAARAPRNRSAAPA